MTPASTQTTLTVEGMHCKSCIRHINQALEGLEGVESCEVQLRAGKVTVVHDAALGVERLISTLREEGYPAQRVVNG